MEQDAAYLAAADSIILLLDPLQMHGAGNEPGPEFSFPP